MRASGGTERSYWNKHERIRSVTCCPRCRRAPELTDAFTLRGIPLAAGLRCTSCGDIGRVVNLKYLLTEPAPASGGAEPRAAHGTLRIEERFPAAHEMSPAGSWKPGAPDMYFSEGAGDCLRLETDGCLGIALNFLRHPWSGIVRVRVDGSPWHTLDLYGSAGSMRLWHPLWFGGGRHTVEVENTGDKHPDSHAPHVWLGAVEYLSLDEAGPDDIQYRGRNNGNPYPARFDDLLAACGPDALVLDCGSGDRCHDDPRVVNFEYSMFQSPDVFGDGHALPFKDESFDLILSQAVMEHVYDPELATSELFRCLKPGGVVYCESAFMQPLHAVPYHFFNTTGWGLERLFRRFEIVDAGHAGSLGQTLDWIYGLTSLKAKGLGDKVEEILRLQKELDSHISHEELRQFASFVWLQARKPL